MKPAPHVGHDQSTTDTRPSYLEHLTGSLFLESQEEVRRYTVIFDHLRAEALGTGQSIDLITRLAAEMT